MKPNAAVETADSSGATKPKKGPLGKIIGLAVLAVVIVFGAKHIAWSKSHEATDNAQVSGDVVQISPQVGGIVEKILVKDNQEVKQGDLLLTIDDDKFEAAVTQAKANLEAAMADAKAAGIDVEYTRASAQASKLQSSGSVAQADAGIGTAQTSILAANAQLLGSKASARSADSDVLNAKTDLKTAKDSVERAKAAVDSARAALKGSQASIGAAEAAVKTAQAQKDLAKQNLDRAQYLVQQGAMSKQQLDTATANDRTASANLDSAKQMLEVARATVNQRSADLKSALAQQRTSENALSQAGIKIQSAKEKAEAAHANVELASAQIASAKQSVSAANAKRTQSLGEQQLTETTDIQVKQKEAARDQALARVEQAKGALRTAELDFEHTKIYAPCDGKVSKKIAETGATVQAGSLLMSIVPKDSVYVVANFKETQIANIKAGEPVDIEVDGFPGVEFKGHIDSSSAATGATFALLPPDNATGNFVKVVQRVPVKIVLDDEPEKVGRLHVGMSALVTVSVK